MKYVKFRGKCQQISERYGATDEAVETTGKHAN